MGPEFPGNVARGAKEAGPAEERNADMEGKPPGVESTCEALQPGREAGGIEFEVGQGSFLFLEEGTAENDGVEQDAASASGWGSDPYLQTGIALFAADANAQVPTKESAPKIAVQTSSTSSWLAENEFGAEALVRVNGLADAFKALGGQAQYTAADAVRGTYVLSDDSLGVDASIIALMQQPSGYCVALLDSNSQLKQAVADALSSITDGGLMTVLEKKWLGVEWDLSDVPLTAGATSQPEEEAAGEGDAAEGEGEGQAPAEGSTNAVTPEDVAAA